MTIELKTAIPGPRSRELLARQRQVIAPVLDVLHPLYVASAQGATVTDVDGNTFLDFTGGVGVLNVGHAHPRVVAAAQAQLERFTHTDFTVLPYQGIVELAERLLALAPIKGEGRAAFFNSGAEAVENAVKFAKLHTGRRAVIAFRGAFHGRTQMALSLTHKAQPYKVGLGPFMEVYRAPYPDAYRGPSGPEALAALVDLLTVDVLPQDVAAVIIEPVLGEGGFHVAPKEFLQGVRALCDEHGIVLICDEVQSGFGRTGTMFAIEHSGVTPDLITVAKSLAGGLPLSGVLGKASVMDSAPPGAIGGTYIGNPVACAAALAVLDVFAAEGLLARGQEIGLAVRARMERWQARYAEVGDVRGLGPMLAIELVEDEQKTPAPALATQVLAEAAARGLLLLKAGLYGNCVRVLVPLVIDDEDLWEALDVWEAALEAVLGDGPLLESELGAEAPEHESVD